MKLLYIADGRSPIALNWIDYFIHGGHEVHLASTYPCMPVERLASMHLIPVAMSGSYGQPEDASLTRDLSRKLMPVALRTKIRQLLAPMTFPRAISALQHVIIDVQPDLIHGMRIPYEGMIASMAVEAISVKRGRQNRAPLLISVWGNDFTLHARSTPRMYDYTLQVLQTSDALHTDCRRDMKLAQELGFASSKPGIVLPGGGGIKIEVFYPPENNQEKDMQPDGRKPLMTVINPRGIRSYVRNDTFFHAIPHVLKKYPEVRFICPGMAGERQAQKYVSELEIEKNVELFPAQSQQAMAGLFRQAQISVSISMHDGTPNTLLEAMACGCFPIAGDLESIREWISTGENGSLVEPDDVHGLAEAILSAIEKPAMRWQARERNLQLVKERAEYSKTMRQVEEFYKSLVSKKL